MHAALRKNVGHRVAHDLADAQLALRAAGDGVLFVVAGHWSSLEIVMPALVAGLHIMLLNQAKTCLIGQDVDGRNRSGHAAIQFKKSRRL